MNSIYGFWLPLSYLQALLWAKTKIQHVTDFQINCNGHLIKLKSSSKYLGIDIYWLNVCYILSLNEIIAFLVPCYLLSFGKLVVNPVHVSCWQKIIRGNQMIIVEFNYLIQNIKKHPWIIVIFLQDKHNINAMS